MATGGPVLKRLRGTPGEALTHEVAGQRIQFNTFSTIGAPDWPAPSVGVLYYEVEILNKEGVPQFGFASSEFSTSNGHESRGVGDDDNSWGVDGTRCCMWHGGMTEPWPCAWSVGDVIGLAVNVSVGKIAVSKN